MKTEEGLTDGAFSPASGAVMNLAGRGVHAHTTTLFKPEGSDHGFLCSDIRVQSGFSPQTNKSVLCKRYIGTDISKMTPVQKHLSGLESRSRATLTTSPYLAGRASPPVQVRARSSGPAAHAIPPVQPEPSHLLSSHLLSLSC